MLYINLLQHFKNNTEHYKFMENCLKHIENKNICIEMDDNFIDTVYALTHNKEFDFYVSLNEYFNTTKQTPVNVNSIEYTTKLLFSIATFVSLLRLIIPQSIPDSFFLIHSAMRYNINQDISLSEYGVEQENAITSLLLIEKAKPHIFSSIINAFMSNTIDYANRYSTDFALINGYLEDLDTFKDLELELVFFTPFYTGYFCKIFEWSLRNKHPRTLYYYSMLNMQSEIIQSKGIDISKENEFQNYINYVNIETTLLKYKRHLEQEYSDDELVDFYENNKNNVNFSAHILLLTELFTYVNEKVYLNIIKDEIKKFRVSSQTQFCKLIEQIEVLDFNVLSPYLLYLAHNKKDDFIEFLNETYGCSSDILNSTIFFIHSDGVTYINDSTSSKLKVKDQDLHYNLIHYINDLFTLSITVDGESENQRLFERFDKDKENKPNFNKTMTEKKFIDAIYEYYYINSRELDVNYEYIFAIQHIRVPLQQVLYKKYNKLFPIVKFPAKIKMEEKKVKRVIHITLDDFSTNIQEEEMINYLNELSEEINFEYKHITEKTELINILNSDEYAIISISSHGEVNTRAPLENKIKIGNDEITWIELDPNKYTLTNKRLLYLNICDSGYYSCKNGFMMESLSTFLTSNNQATISHMWPVAVNYSSVFLMLFLHQLNYIDSFKEAYSQTLSLAVNYDIDSYIEDNNLQHIKLFEVFLNDSLKQKSIINWGSMLYQE